MRKSKTLPFLSSFLICMLTSIHSEATTEFAIKTYGTVASNQQKLITNAFLYLNKFWADKGKSLSPNITAEYFTPDTILIINGKTVYTGYKQFESHFKEVGKNIVGKIHFPLLEVISVDNDKLVVRFDEDIHDNNGNYYPTNVMAIFTLKNNKIQRWEEVVNSNYFCQTQSSSVVYSN